MQRAAIGIGAAIALLAGCAAAAPDAIESPPPVIDPSTALELAVQARLDVLAGDYAVTVVELDGAERALSIQGSQAREPASVIKLFAAYAVLDRIDEGTLTPQTVLPSGVPVADCLRVMIVVSDNLCHWELVETMGQEALTAQFAEEGYPATRYPPGYGEAQPRLPKTTSTDDLALLLTRLHGGELLSAGSSAALLDLMSSQVFRQRIAAGLPAGVAVANKTGQLILGEERVEGDAGIVAGPEGTYVVAILGGGAATTWGVRSIAEAVHTALYGSFSPVGDAESGRLETIVEAELFDAPEGSPIGTLPPGTSAIVQYSLRLWIHVEVGGHPGWLREEDVRSPYR